MHITTIFTHAKLAMSTSNEDSVETFASMCEDFVSFEVEFPDGSKRQATDELNAYEIARVWLANRLSKQDDPTWKPSHTTLRDLGVRISGLLKVSY